MKKLIIAFTLLLGCINVYSQDKIVMKDGTEINAKVLESNSKRVIYVYPNEEVKNEKSKSVIDYILYASGRKEEGMKIPTVSGEKDWEMVLLTNDKEDVEGLTKVKNVSSKGGNAWAKRDAVRKNVEEKIKKKAAKLGCGIVLITEESHQGMYSEVLVLSGDCYK